MLGAFRAKNKFLKRKKSREIIKQKKTNTPGLERKKSMIKDIMSKPKRTL